MDLTTQPIAKTATDEQVYYSIRNDAGTSANAYEVRTAIEQPICTVDFKASEIHSMNAQVETGPGTYYNSHYGSSWVLHWPGHSFIHVRSNLEHRDASKKYYLDLFHLSAVVGGSLTDSPITIVVNKCIVASGHNPNNGGYISERFDISDFVIDGNNSIEIRFDAEARTNYWIQSLAIIES